MTRALAALVAAALLAVGCGSSDDDSGLADTTQPPPATSATDPAGATPTPTGSTTTTTQAPSTTTVAPTTVAPTTTDDPTDGAGFDEPGPWGVGRREVALTDAARDRTLPVDVVYPVDPSTTGDPSIYRFIPGIEFASAAAIADAAPATGAFPVVVYSHGAGGARWLSTFLTEHLASHGFVVVAADHLGDTLIERLGESRVTLEELARIRPADVDFLVASTASPTGIAEFDEVMTSVDPTTVGVIGHSVGGYTALASATDELGTDGVDAVVALAPVSSVIPDDELTSIRVPTLLIGATQDLTTPVADHLPRPFDLISGRPLIRVDLIDAGHMSFADVCDYRAILEDLTAIPEFLFLVLEAFEAEACAPGLLDVDEAQRLTKLFTTAFLVEHLVGGEVPDVFGDAFDDAEPDVEVESAA